MGRWELLPLLVEASVFHARFLPASAFRDGSSQAFGGLARSPQKEIFYAGTQKVITSTSPGYTKQDELLKPLAVRQVSQT